MSQIDEGDGAAAGRNGADAFYALATKAQLTHLTALATEALSAWTLSDPVVEPIKYRENAVFAVRSGGGQRHVLRLHRPGYRSDAEILSEFQWMAALGEAGIATPGVVATRAGGLVTTVRIAAVPEPRQCDLFEWVEGGPVGTVEGGATVDDDRLPDTYRVIGEIAARIHRYGAEWHPPAAFVRPVWDADALVGDAPTFGGFWELECLTQAQLAVLVRARDAVRERLAAFGEAPDRYGLLHGDLLPENLLAGPDGLRLIDFDDSGPGWYLFELATSLIFLLERPDYADIQAALLEGYGSVRPLVEGHIALLPTFLMARALSYLGWPASRPEIELYSQLAPQLAAMMTGMAERYLAGEL